MARGALHLYDIGCRFSDLASERVIDVGDHFHHHARRLLLLLLVGSCIQRHLPIRTRLSACLFGMAIVAAHAKAHRELLHHLDDLLARPIFRQHLKVRRRRTATSLSAATAAFTAATAATRRLLSCERNGHHHAKKPYSESNNTAFSHIHLDFSI
jgi:hypothetical protein